MTTYRINQTIEEASTLPSSFYRDNECFQQSKDSIFSKTWQFVCTADHVRTAESAYPFYYMPDFIEEPLILTRNEKDEVNCLSNVCTHRGNILIHSAGNCKNIVCKYHGRKFDLDGKFQSMPSFKEARNFPTEADNLTNVPFAQFRQFIFSSLEPAFPFEEIVSILERKIGFINFGDMTEDTSRHRIYLVKSHWALYCDNYLEGFHIPFVHPGLNQALDPKDYSTEIYPYVNIQVGIAEEGTEFFDLPVGHEDYGKKIAAYYFWIFPNLMLNFYPWGLSVNIVRPVNINRTKVEYRTYITDPQKIDHSAGAELDKVEREDEEVVESVQKGMASRFYDHGRFSPSMEKGVHHFHMLLADFLNK